MSNSKYIRLQELVFDTFNLEAPVEIGKGALLLESTSKTVLLQLRLNVLDNVDEISSISLNIYGFTDFGEEVEGSSPFNYTYSDFYLQGSKSFGERTPIILDSKIRKATVTIEKVVYRNGDVWRNTGDDFQRPVQKSITSIDVDLLPQFQRETSSLSETDKQQLLYIPQQVDDYWLCTCGRPNRIGNSLCSRCGLHKEVIFKVTDSDFLQKNLDIYNEKTRIAEEERKLLVAKRKRQLILGFVSIIAIASILSLFFFVVQPALKYSQATSLLEKKDFGGAISVFTALDDYKDSSDMVKESTYQKGMDLLSNKMFDDSIAIFSGLVDYKESSTMINEGNYQKATELLENDEYDDAFALFSSLQKYRDSISMAQESTYRKAKELLASEYFQEARDIFSSIQAYKDSSTLALEANFHIATGLLAQKEFESARAIFLELGNHGISVEMVKEVDYQIAKKMITENHFEEAVSTLQKITDYKDASELLQTANYQIALDLFAEGQYSESLQLFTDLRDYKDSKSYIDAINLELINQNEQRARIRGMRLTDTLFGPLYPTDSIFVWTPNNELLFAENDRQTVSIVKNNSRLVLSTDYIYFTINAIFSPDREKIAFNSHGFVEIWDINSRKVVQYIDSNDWIEDWSPDGTMLLGHNNETGIKTLWDLATGSPVMKIPSSSFIGFSPDGQILAVYPFKRENIELWDIILKKKKDSLSYEIDTSHYPPTCFSPDGNHFAYGENNYVKVWDINNRFMKEFSFGSARITWCKWADNTKLAVGTEKEFVFWNYGKESIFFRNEGQFNYDFINITRFSPDGLTYEILDRIQGEYTIWDAKTQELFLTIPDVDFVIGWSPSGTKFAFIDSDYNVRIWGLP